jgi:hypothetical protein
MWPLFFTPVALQSTMLVFRTPARSDHRMKTSISVFELCVPDRTRTRLEFGGGLCGGKFAEFQALSENTLFACGAALRRR